MLALIALKRRADRRNVYYAKHIYFEWQTTMQCNSLCLLPGGLYMKSAWRGEIDHVCCSCFAFLTVCQVVGGGDIWSCIGHSVDKQNSGKLCRRAL